MNDELSNRAVERLLAFSKPIAEAPQLASLDLQRYEVRDVLGTGGMGVVYEAWDRELGRKVALKVFSHLAGRSEQARQRFLREARAAARLVHPHIAAVYDATPEAISMQRIDGVTLAEFRFEDPRELVPLIRDAALAIHFAHGEGIVHRDLKPANLMVELGDRPHVYVMDFGLAKELESESSLSLTGNVVGTPAYMAPEQAAGQNQETGPETDVYGLGATLYACLSGRELFGDQDVYRLLRRVVEEEPKPLHEVAPRVDRDLSLIVGKAISKEKPRRYPSALELAGDLERWLAGEPVHARPASLAYRFRRFVSRKQGAVITGVLAATLAFLVSLPFLVQSSARRAAAERERQLVEQVLELSETVNEALRDAASAKASGVGHEQSAHEILEGAIQDCRQFLVVADVGHVHFYLGRLLKLQGALEEALAAFDRAADLRDDLRGLQRDRGLVLATLYRDSLLVVEEDHPRLEGWKARSRTDLEATLESTGSNEPSLDEIFASAHLRWMNDDLRGAVSLLKEVVERDVTHREAHLSLAKLYLVLDEETLAMRHSVRAVDLMRGYQPAYLASQAPETQGIEVDKADPESEFLTFPRFRELLYDFNLLLRKTPSDAYTFAMRGQVQIRNADRALATEDEAAASKSLEQAEHDFGLALTMVPNDPFARVNRAVCRIVLSRIVATTGETRKSRDLFAGAEEDLDTALAVRTDLVPARFNRALLRKRRGEIKRLAMDSIGFERELRAAREDADRALSSLAEDHPERGRIVELSGEIEAQLDG